MSENRWSIWIDIEGFSSLYQVDQSRAIFALGFLMEAIFLIGSKIYPKAPERLFVHQFGDGFVIVSDFPEASAERPIAIAICLMRHLIAAGIACKSGIACGGFADVSGCYPQVVLEQVSNGHLVNVGEGLMTITPVMGTTLIASHKLSGKRKGAVLLLHDACFTTIPEGIVVRKAEYSTVDWVHSNLDITRRISREAGLIYLNPAEAEISLRQYINSNKLNVGEEWTLSTIGANGLEDSEPAV
jgi:hypothetical protein